MASAASSLFSPYVPLRAVTHGDASRTRTTSSRPAQLAIISGVSTGVAACCAAVATSIEVASSFRSSLTIALCPWPLARCSGVKLCRVRNAGLALPRRSTRATRGRPYWLAVCRAVEPSRSRMSGYAPSLSNHRTWRARSPSLPLPLLAYCRAVSVSSPPVGPPTCCRTCCAVERASAAAASPDSASFSSRPTGKSSSVGARRQAPGWPSSSAGSSGSDDAEQARRFSGSKKPGSRTDAYAPWAISSFASAPWQPCKAQWSGDLPPSAREDTL
eukprot:3214178-Prymnesium_polylepis.2